MKYLNYEIPQEKGRKYLKQFLKNSIVVRKLMKRDYEEFLKFFKNFEDLITESFQSVIYKYNEFLFVALFDQWNEEINRDVSCLQEAVDYVKKIYSSD